MMRVNQTDAMMGPMDLILWRHAEAEDSLPDLQRALTPKGEKQARRVGEWLHARLPNSARILVSPAKRAQQTAQFLAELSDRKLKTLDVLAPGARADAVLTAAGWPQSRHTVVIVGHQPTLGEVAGHLLCQRGECAVRKGAAWWLASREGDDGAPLAVIRAVISPELG